VASSPRGTDFGVVIEAAPSASAADILTAIGARGWTLSVAESLTGGLVAAALVAVPGASAVFRGGIIAYATDLKASLLGVPEPLLAARGAVDPDVALAMASGVRRSLGADVGLATTGVAGPDPQCGHAPGLVFVAVATASTSRVERLRLTGDRGDIRTGAVNAVLALVSQMLAA
jgi:nicotinamide-nucleotide amidase